MTNKEEVIKHLLLLKESAVKSDNDTGIINVKLDSFNFVMDMAIKALEYDDAKYHEEHGEVIVDKAVWEDAEMALEPSDDSISRQAVLDLLEDTNNGWIINEVLQLPSVKPQSCEDAMSREELLKAIAYKIWTSTESVGDDYKYIKSVSKPTGIEFDEEQEQLDFVQPHKSIPVKLKVEPSGDLISRQDAITAIDEKAKRIKNEDTLNGLAGAVSILFELPSVNPLPKIGHCKDCKWWRDSDGAYRRGVKAESRCPINTVSVANGWGYCYMFEPQESGDEECR